ncbi:MAG TPA: NUDIX hydrolase [Jatrophihabitans sp.]|jgi:8-oxo-dGTP pyrophosphatase MutT (NUDIX family)|uniref:NUDIX domain-containing protein n=1 Tax=Jatrophihabitans sp. TaxID=1932789 RepID=UPI002F18B033
MFEITQHEIVHRNPWFGVVSAVVGAAGDEHPYFWVEKPDSSLVIARERASGAWVMLRCQRPTFPGEWTLEFPQGGLDTGERAEDAAERELVEETGHRVLSLRRLGVLQEAAGFATSRVHVFSADVARDAAPRPEPLEAQNEVVELPDAEVRSALLAGRIVDASSVAALALIYLTEGQA